MGGQTQASPVSAKAVSSELPVEEPISETDEPIDE